MANSFDNIHAAVSPNGRWLAYASNESGAWQVIVQPFPDPTGGKWQISSAGEGSPRWRRDGRELFYLTLDGQIVAVAVTTDGPFEIGKSTPLFETQLSFLSAGAVPYDVAADGQRFIVAVPRSVTGSTTALTVTLNWMEGLKK